MALAAGLGSTTITPVLPVHLAGYGDRRGVAIDVSDDLRVYALVVDDGTKVCCILTFDVLAMSRDVSGPIRDEIATRLGCAPAAVVTSCTHVHAAPSALTGTDAIGWPVPEGFPALLAARALDAVDAARAAAEPVAARFARVALPGDIAVNRRGHPLAPSAALLMLGRVATLVNFGIHPTVTGPSNVAVSTDWVGPFRRFVTDATGVPVVFLQGCQGDVNPAVEAWDDGDPAAWSPVVEAYAQRLADAVASVVAQGEPVGERVQVDEPRVVRVPVGDTLLAHLAGGARHRAVELLGCRIGDVRVATVPGEGFHAVEQELRAAAGDRLLIAGLAPEWHGYLPRPYSDGYEEGLSLGPDAVDQLVAALTTLR